MEETKAPQTPSQDYFSRDVSDKLLLAYTDLIEDISIQKGNSNNNKYKLRAFTLPSGAATGFVDMKIFRSQFGDHVEALYIFKFDGIDPNGYTHAIYLRLKGYGPRRKLEKFIESFVELFAGVQVVLHAIDYKQQSNESLQAYMKKIYVNPQNLLVNYSDRKDALGNMQQDAVSINHSQAAGLRDKAIKQVTLILENMMLLPDQYKDTSLKNLLNMTPIEYKNYMRTNSLNDVLSRVADDAYSLALQDKTMFAEQAAQMLSNPTTKTNMIRTILTGKQAESLQKLLHEQFACPFVHPHPFNELAKGAQLPYNVFEGMLLDYRFLFPFLMVSRWLAKTCMRKEQAISNNHAQLALYGTTGTGKSYISSIISKCIPTYKYVPKGEFQNPDLLKSSILLFEEFDTVQLATNTFKQIFDINSHIKINFKYLQPEDATENMPCIVTTNDEILTALRHIKDKKPAFYGQAITKESIEAAIRRMYIVPLKGGQFDKIHNRPVPDSNSSKAQTNKHANSFVNEPDKLNRMFNLLFALALSHQDITNISLSPNLARYIQKVVFDFDKTVFAKFIMMKRGALHTLYSEVEQCMNQADLSDIEFYTTFCHSQTQFYKLQQEFISDTTGKLGENFHLFQDPQIPWPLKMYTIFESKEFQYGIKTYDCKYKQYMNRDVAYYLSRPENMLYVPAQEDDSNSDDFDIESILGKRSSSGFPFDFD